jgi:hypothetical protein
MAFNNGPKLVTQGLNLLVDAGDPTSYPGSGTTWRDVVGGQNGTITGSVSYSSAFYGGLVFSGPTASVIFPTSSANFGTSSFTVELAFRPAQIQGIHYLISKNSGSFPSWGIYLSGSGGSGKLFSEFRISSTVSCSVSSSTTFVTGSNYQVDVRMVPGASGSGFYVDGVSIGGGLGNGGGSLTSTGSLLIGNIASSSSQAFSGSLFTTKIYSINTLNQPVQNYNAIASRLSKAPLVNAAVPVFELLVVAGGGSGGGQTGGGGGAGGLQYFSNFTPAAGINTVVVGAGGSGGAGTGNQGTNGQNSSTINTITSLGGGGGGSGGNPGKDGGSGGGGGATVPTPTSSFGLGTSGQGNNGAFGATSAVAGGVGGGGGGAGSAGNKSSGSLASPTYQSPNGGSGSYIASFTTIGGVPAGWFAGGGGGGAQGAQGYNGFGGIGGGGLGNDQTATTPTTGSVNTGGGGGA